MHELFGSPFAVVFTALKWAWLDSSTPTDCKEWQAIPDISDALGIIDIETALAPTLTLSTIIMLMIALTIL
jgi:hypothetical protein